MSTSRMFYPHRSPYVTASGGCRNSPYSGGSSDQTVVLIMNLINSKLIFLWDSQSVRAVFLLMEPKVRDASFLAAYSFR